MKKSLRFRVALIYVSGQFCTMVDTNSIIDAVQTADQRAQADGYGASYKRKNVVWMGRAA